jgi:hypothetical protein
VLFLTTAAHQRLKPLAVWTVRPSAEERPPTRRATWAWRLTGIILLAVSLFLLGYLSFQAGAALADRLLS